MEESSNSTCNVNCWKIILRVWLPCYPGTVKIAKAKNDTLTQMVAVGTTKDKGLAEEWDRLSKTSTAEKS